MASCQKSLEFIPSEDPAINNFLVNNARSPSNLSASVCLASPRSFLLFLLLHLNIYFSFCTSPHFSSAKAIWTLPLIILSICSPLVSQLSLSHVNKWWPSWHDHKFVFSEINSTLWRKKYSNISAAAPKGAHLWACAPANARAWHDTHTHTCSCTHQIPAEPSQVTVL